MFPASVDCNSPQGYNQANKEVIKAVSRYKQEKRLFICNLMQPARCCSTELKTYLSQFFNAQTVTQDIRPQN